MKTLRNILISFCFLCCTVLIPGPADCSSASVDYLSELGIAFYRLGKYNEALAEFKKAAILDPDNQTVKNYIYELSATREQDIAELKKGTKNPEIKKPTAAKPQIEEKPKAPEAQKPIIEEIPVEEPFKETMEVQPEAIAKEMPEAYTLNLKEVIAEARKNLRKAGEEIQQEEILEENKGKEAQVRTLVEKGNTLRKEGKIKEAMKEWQEAISFTRDPAIQNYIQETSKRTKEEEINRRKKEKEQGRLEAENKRQEKMLKSDQDQLEKGKHLRLEKIQQEEERKNKIKEKQEHKLEAKKDHQQKLHLREQEQQEKKEAKQNRRLELEKERQEKETLRKLEKIKK